MIRPSRNGSLSPTRASAGRQAGPCRSQAQDAASLRRESAPVGGALSAGRSGSPRRRPGEQVQGKELSYNNLNDANAALELVAEFREGEPTVVIVKHANPCGVATRDSLLDAWSEALACDSVSAFGGIVATNRALDAATAEAIAEIFTEVVVAPDADDDAKAIFARKKNLRLLLTGDLARSGARRDQPRADRRRPPGPGSRQWHGRARPAQMRDEAPADRAGSRRLPVRLDRRQARQVERDRLCQGWGHRRHRRRPDEPPRQRAHRRAAGRRKRPKPTAGPSRAPSVRRSRRTPSSPSPTVCWPPPKPARPR